MNKDISHYLPKFYASFAASLANNTVRKIIKYDKNFENTGGPLDMRIRVMRILLMRLFKQFSQYSTYAIFPHKYSTYAIFLHE